MAFVNILNSVMSLKLWHTELKNKNNDWLIGELGYVVRVFRSWDMLSGCNMSTKSIEIQLGMLV